MTKAITNRVVLLTGAGGGIGSAVAAALIRAGHSIAAVDCNKSSLEKLASSRTISQASERFLWIAANLVSEAECKDAVRVAALHFGRIEGVINNAGIGVSAIRPDAEKRHPTIAEISTETWDRFFAVNVRAAMLITKAALPYMEKQKWGRIINNTTSYRTMLRVLTYGATKSALESMSAVWAEELKGTGITVNVLVPGGPTDTALIADESGWARDKMLRPQIMDLPACWLISDDSNLVTGQRITASKWDSTLPGLTAAWKASRPIGWPELAAKPAWWQVSQ